MSRLSTRLKRLEGQSPGRVPFVGWFWTCVLWNRWDVAALESMTPEDRERALEAIEFFRNPPPIYDPLEEAIARDRGREPRPMVVGPDGCLHDPEPPPHVYYRDLPPDPNEGD